MSEHNWDKRFIELAQFISSWSKDPSSKIGAVIVDENRRIISTGYNGFARWVADHEHRYENRELKYKMVLHAEENAILFAKQNLDGCSIYINVMPPCSHCAALIIQSGIANVFVPKCPIPDRWKDSIELTEQMFYEAGVTLHFVDMGCDGPTEKERLNEENERFSSLSQNEQKQIRENSVSEINEKYSGKSLGEIETEIKENRRKNPEMISKSIQSRRTKMLTVRKLIDYLKTQNPDACVMGYEPNSFGFIEQLPDLPNKSICTVKEDRERERQFLLGQWYRNSADAEKKCEDDIAETYRYCNDDDVIIRF